jgi:hypothetical protein
LKTPSSAAETLQATPLKFELFYAPGRANPFPTPLASQPWRLLNSTRSRPSILPVLYATFIGLEAYDGYSTLKGTKQGASESNPLLRGFTDKPGAVWAVKGGAAFASIYFAERLWRSHHRGEAIVVMTVSNGIMAAIAARNLSVIRAQR